jgi:hypothetical protein
MIDGPILRMLPSMLVLFTHNGWCILRRRSRSIARERRESGWSEAVDRLLSPAPSLAAMDILAYCNPFKLCLGSKDDSGSTDSTASSSQEHTPLLAGGGKHLRVSSAVSPIPKSTRSLAVLLLDGDGDIVSGLDASS